MTSKLTSRVTSQGSGIHISSVRDSSLKGQRFKSQEPEIQISRSESFMLQGQNIKCYRLKDFRIRDPNLKSQRFKLYCMCCLQSQGSEIQTSRVRDSNLKGQRFKSQGPEIQISRVRDSNPKGQGFKSLGSETQVSTQPVSTTEAKTKTLSLLLSTFYRMFRSRYFCCFYRSFFIAITDDVFVSTDINITMITFSTYLNTTWTIT